VSGFSFSRAKFRRGGLWLNFVEDGNSIRKNAGLSNADGVLAPLRKLRGHKAVFLNARHEQAYKS
jgi:hypothetical protein